MNPKLRDYLVTFKPVAVEDVERMGADENAKFRVINGLAQMKLLVKELSKALDTKQV